jgi:hypothetical protein
MQKWFPYLSLIKATSYEAYAKPLSTGVQFSTPAGGSPLKAKMF